MLHLSYGPTVLCIIFTLTVSFIHSNSQLSLQFRPVKASNGSSLCAVDSPSYSVSVDDILGIPPGVPDVVRCSYQCTALSGTQRCTGFNYIDSDSLTGQCRLYSDLPVNCSTVIPFCQFHEIVPLQTNPDQQPIIACALDRDIDECLTNNGNCDVKAKCTNTIGSFTCTCHAGYTGSGFQCTDVNECATLNGGCSNADCVNTIGSFFCTCHVQYCGDGFSCTVMPTANRALQKTAWQSSTIINDPTYAANKAVDGNTYAVLRATILLNSCSHTADADVNPWWAVDLEVLVRVQRVDITNRAGCCPERLNNIVVGVTNNPPTNTAPSSGNIIVCGLGPAVAGAIVSVQCPATMSAARYVAILSPQEYLTLCEVQVYGCS